MKKITYHLGARLDVLEIVQNYERGAEVALADRFTSELELLIEFIAERPHSYSEN